MAKRRTDSNRRNTGRRDLAALLMMLLPGFMFLGLLAPAAVKIKSIAEETAGPISFRHFAPRRPIQFPLTLVHAVLPDTGLDPVFSSARYLADQAKRVFEPDVASDAAVERGDRIVLAAEDGVHDYVAETLFDESIDQTVLAVDLTPLWDPSVFDVIPGIFMRNGYSQWDDFHGTGAIVGRAPQQPSAVPEPATGALFALGLTALALRRRR